MDKHRQEFKIRPGTLGDRLYWRFPFATADGRDLLRPVLLAEQQRALSAGQPPPREPNSITVGYFIELDDPPGMWTFGAVNTVWAKAALSLPALQKRIALELAARLSQPGDLQT